MSDVTVLYYSSNREESVFEDRIVTTLEAVVGTLPIISVTQKPIALGHNICVGDVGACYANEYRQILIGAQAAKTEWIISAESDCLYPPAYFTFRPSDGDLWRYDNVWILWRSLKYGGGRFKPKQCSEGAQVFRREFLISRLSEVMAGLPEWHDPQNDWKKKVYVSGEWQTFGNPHEPVISVKTGLGMRPYTQTIRDAEPQAELPFWGTADQLRKELFE